MKISIPLMSNYKKAPPPFKQIWLNEGGAFLKRGAFLIIIPLISVSVAIFLGPLFGHFFVFFSKLLNLLTLRATRLRDVVYSPIEINPPPPRIRPRWPKSGGKF